MPDNANSPSDLSSLSSTKFSIALSFSGDHRAYVRAVADLLKAKLNNKIIDEVIKPGFDVKELKHQVLYDQDYSSDFSDPKLNTILPPIYRDNSDLIVVFCSDNYVKRERCQLEWEKIKQVQDGGKIMLLFVGDEFVKDEKDNNLNINMQRKVLAELDISGAGTTKVVDKRLHEIVEDIYACYQKLIQKQKQKFKLQDASTKLSFYTEIAKVYEKPYEKLLNTDVELLNAATAIVKEKITLAQLDIDEAESKNSKDSKELKDNSNAIIVKYEKKYPIVPKLLEVFLKNWESQKDDKDFFVNTAAELARSVPKDQETKSNQPQKRVRDGLDTSRLQVSHAWSQE